MPPCIAKDNSMGSRHGNVIFNVFAIVVLTVSSCCWKATGADGVPQFINYYEVVNYTFCSIPEQLVGVTRRSFPTQRDGFTFNFTAFKRNFFVVLRPNKNIFQANVQVRVVSNEKEERKLIKEHYLYEGELKDESGSRVSGYIINDLFSGSITTKSRETFYLEPRAKNVGDSDGPTRRSGIIYRPSDINYGSGDYDHEPLQVKHTGTERASKKYRKRAAKQSSSCPVLLAADSSFYKKAGNDQEQQTLALMAYHLNEADHIFRKTTFIEGEDIGLVIAALTVFKDAESEGVFSSPADVDIETYLKRWSKVNHGSYCLSILFTYRDFEDGLLGLAWRADLYNLGGICEPWNTNYNQSFNTALVTFLNQERLIPSKVATLTLTHELGHAFGAKHDLNECQPNGDEGNYVMYRHTTDTAHRNNDHFSSCSIKDMRAIIEERAHHCFTDGTSYCGNKLVESGEECDCGDTSECVGYDHCCIAKDKGIDGCSLQPTAECSPKANPCCSDDCQFVEDSEKKVCREETDCSYMSLCKNGSCPLAQPKADRKICNNGSNVCQNGLCTGSICLLYNYTECLCLKLSDVCNVCCTNQQGNCLSSVHFTGRVVPQPSKKPCHVNGYCDGAGRCIEHDDQPYETHPKDSFHAVMTWIGTKWYVFVFVAISIIAKFVYSSYAGYRRCCVPQRPQPNRGLEMVEIEQNGAGTS